MEQYRIAWPPSPSLNVDRHELYVGIDGGTPGKINDLVAAATSQNISVPTGATVKVFVRTFGDNGSQADSPILTFASSNQTPVLPVGTLTATWLGHTV